MCLGTLSECYIATLCSCDFEARGMLSGPKEVEGGLKALWGQGNFFYLDVFVLNKVKNGPKRPYNRPKRAKNV